MDEKLKRASDVRRASSLANKENFDVESRNRLAIILSKKIKTTFIGDISRVEEALGMLWGHGKPEHQLNDDEREWRKIWEELRSKILDNGNNQIRTIEKELLEYKISWNRYNLSIPVVSKEDRNNV
jgi:hypothetical protein